MRLFCTSVHFFQIYLHLFVYSHWLSIILILFRFISVIAVCKFISINSFFKCVLLYSSGIQAFFVVLID